MTAQQLAPWCKRGHEMTPDNIRLGRCGERLCKTCLRLHLRAVRAPKMDTTGVGPRRGVPPTIRDTPSREWALTPSQAAIGGEAQKRWRLVPASCV